MVSFPCNVPFYGSRHFSDYLLHHSSPGVFIIAQSVPVGGAGVVEIIKDYRGDTFRTVYTLRYAGAVYVLHAFQKKSKTGRETPKRDIALVKHRLREAEQLARERKP